MKVFSSWIFWPVSKFSASVNKKDPKGEEGRKGDGDGLTPSTRLDAPLLSLLFLSYELASLLLIEKRTSKANLDASS